jgi:hypothetical protein
MKTKKSEVKQHVITEYGREETIYERAYIVEIPAGVDPESLDGHELSVAADAALGWEEGDPGGIEHDYFGVEGTVEEVACDGLPVIRLDISAEEGSND